MQTTETSLTEILKCNAYEMENCNTNDMDDMEKWNVYGMENCNMKNGLWDKMGNMQCNSEILVGNDYRKINFKMPNFCSLIFSLITMSYYIMENHFRAEVENSFEQTFETSLDGLMFAEKPMMFTLSIVAR